MIYALKCFAVAIAAVIFLVVILAALGFWSSYDNFE